MTEKNYCVCKCGHKHCIDKRQISLYAEMVTTLARIYKWCVENNKHEFQRKEIKHLLRSENDTANFGDWVYFGGLAYKVKKNGVTLGNWGLNMERCEKFFSGQSVIATKVLKDPITKEVEKFDYKHESDIEGLHKFLNENGLYNPNYVPRNLFKDERGEDDVIKI